jgi:hypothetical protein
MIDKSNPTSQFHPYQPVDATPVADREPSRMRDKIRSMAANRPGIVLGGLAAAAIGLGMLRGRRT